MVILINTKMLLKSLIHSKIIYRIISFFNKIKTKVYRFNLKTKVKKKF